MYGAAELNVPKVVAVLGYMNLMRLPMALTPKMLGAFVDSLVSYGRLGTFLFKGDEIVERKKFPRIKKNQKYIVQVKKNSTFTWFNNTTTTSTTSTTSAATKESEIEVTAELEETPKQQTTLHTATEEMFGETKNNNNNKQWKLQIKETLNINTGALVAVVGLVGSGKSSFLSAILNEMKILATSPEMSTTASNIQVNGAVALVSQKAWIQNATVKNAVLFGDVYDEKKYQKVIQASQLCKFCSHYIYTFNSCFFNFLTFFFSLCIYLLSTGSVNVGGWRCDGDW